MAPTPTAVSLLEELPREVLEEICEHLKAGGRAGRRSVFALSLTSRRIAPATSRFRFETVRLLVKHERKLQREIKTCKDILSAGGYARYVRRLEISGLMLWDESGEAMSDEGNEEEATLPEADDIVGDEWPPEDDDDFWGTSMEPIEFVPTDPKLTTGQDKANEEKAWSSLVAFIPNLIHLKDVVYACKNQVPPSLLRALKSWPYPQVSKQWAGIPC